jgi:hypothetical protein
MMFRVCTKEHYSQTNYLELPEAAKLLPASTTWLYIEDKMSEKLILPTELQVCATCSFWDGERVVDDELKVVVVDKDCEGECLVSETSKSCLNHMTNQRVCLWEDLEPDAAAEGAAP